MTKSGVINFEYDSVLTFLSSVPAPNSIIGNTLVYNYDTLASQENRHINIIFQVPGIQYLGDTLNGYVSISPFVNDTNLANNYDTLTQVITGSYDPNDKIVNPAGYGPYGYVLHNTELEYTIRFQNTGTDTAFFVQVVDTIDLNLDLSTFRIIGSSHPMTCSMNGLNRVVFTFDNILLPDSNTNLTGSNGFVKFSIQPYGGLPENTVVPNEAYIFFDFNPAVLTNEVINTFVSNIHVSNNEITDKNNNVVTYPNPAKSIMNVNSRDIIDEISICTIYGQEVIGLNPGSNKTEINIEGLPNGIYVITVKSRGVNSSRIIIKN